MLPHERGARYSPAEPSACCRGQNLGQLAGVQLRKTRRFCYLLAIFDPHPSHHIRVLVDCNN
jgi:hypothetical protein